MPASPVELPKPLPKMTPHWPLCRRRICGVPKVVPRLLPHEGAVDGLEVDAQPIVLIEAGFHSPSTRLDALLSAKLPGVVTSRAKIAAPPPPQPPTTQECHTPP